MVVKADVNGNSCNNNYSYDIGYTKKDREVY